MPIYAQILYRDIYPGVDMAYGGSNHRLKSEFIVAPGGDASSIRFEYLGVEHVEIDPSGALLLKTPGGMLREEAPEAYQQTQAGRQRVESRFVTFSDGSVGFLLGPYDTARTLIIDPLITYSSYFGGAGMDTTTAMAADASGSTYIAGWTDSANFPTQNPAQTPQHGVDAFIAKFSADGKTLVYCTYLGGHGEDRAYGIAVDASGNAYVAGSTMSTDFPAVNAYQRLLAGSRNAFVAKLNSTGNALVYSTYFGGRAYDNGNGIAIDAFGSAYITGDTTSPDLPLQSAYQASARGGSDGFVAKLLPAGNALAYATYLGGRADDRGRAIAVDSAGAAYITGDTYSPDFPAISAFQSASGGNQDAFVVKLTPAGSILYSSYLGGSGGAIGLPETGSAIAVDALGNAYVAGTTSSFNFPLQNAFQSIHTGSQTDAFVVKVNPSGTGLFYSTYLGGSSVDVATAIGVDKAGQAYVGGYTASADFPATTAAESGNSGGYDGFLVELSASGQQLLQSMRLGGSGNDAVNALVLGPTDLYVAGQTLSTNFPVNNGLQVISAGSMDTFFSRISITQAPPTAGLYFVAITPCRVADTRWATGLFGGPIMAANSTRDFNLPAGLCNIPSSAMAYSLNVSVVPTQQLGFLAIWPAGQPKPVVSTLNSFDGRPKANAVIVPAGTSGGISVFVTGSTHVVVDINGYFLTPANGGALAFYPVTPCRVMDTRLPVGPLGGPALKSGQTRQIPVTGSCGVPSTALAYSLNFTIMPTWAPVDFITVWPTGPARPPTSTLNAATGAVTSNAVIVGAGLNGSITVYTSTDTDMIVDINGYFAPPGTGGLAFYPASPCRVVDTRWNVPTFGAPDLNGTRTFPVSSGVCSLPQARAYSLNVTVVPQKILGFLTLWPAGGGIPVVSTLNSFDGSVIANAAIVPASNGSINAFATDQTVLILDVNGYFAP